jgi:Kef-type K+ transport system membrane component KefB
MPTAAVPVAPVGGHQLLIYLLQVGLLLLTAILLGAAARKAKLPAITGELAAGVLLGPSLLGHAWPHFSNWLLPHDPAQFHMLDAFSQIGLVLLVGLTGMHMDLDLVRKRAPAAARISATGVAIPLALGIGAGFLVPHALRPLGAERSTFALFIGVAMCVSAIPVIAKTLIDMRLMHRTIGQLTLTVGVIDDAIGWLLLAVVSALATTGIGHSDKLTLAFAGLFGLVALALTIGRPLVRLILSFAARSSQSGPTTATCVVLIVLTSALTQSLGLEAAFGAFVMGILISASGMADPARLAGMRNLTLSVLAPLFFATAGLRMDLGTLGETSVALSALGLLALAIAGKFTGAYAGARMSRLTRWEALALGAGMNSRGVVEIIIAIVGLRVGVLNTASYTIIVLIALITSLMAPPILRVAMSRVEHTAEEWLRQSAYGHYEEPVLDQEREAAV